MQRYNLGVVIIPLFYVLYQPLNRDTTGVRTLSVYPDPQLSYFYCTTTHLTGHFKVFGLVRNSIDIFLCLISNLLILITYTHPSARIHEELKLEIQYKLFASLLKHSSILKFGTHNILIINQKIATGAIYIVPSPEIRKLYNTVL